jgi:hypothetical protein
MSHTFEQTCKKRSTDVGEDEFRSKRIGIDHEMANRASSHKQQDVIGALSFLRVLRNDEVLIMMIQTYHMDICTIMNIKTLYVYLSEQRQVTY